MGKRNMSKSPKKGKRPHSTMKAASKHKPKPKGTKVGPMMALVIPAPPAGVYSILCSDLFGNPYWLPAAAAEKYLKGDNTDGWFMSAI